MTRRPAASAPLPPCACHVRLSVSHRRAPRAAVASASGQVEIVLLVHPLLAHYNPSRLVTQPHSSGGLRWEAMGLPPTTRARECLRDAADVPGVAAQNNPGQHTSGIPVR